MPSQLQIERPAPRKATGVAARRAPSAARSPGSLLMMQRAAGNRAVASMMRTPHAAEAGQRTPQLVEAVQRCGSDSSCGCPPEESEQIAATGAISTQTLSIQRDDPDQKPKQPGVGGHVDAGAIRHTKTVSGWGAAAVEVFSKHLKDDTIVAMALIHAKGMQFYSGSGIPRGKAAVDLSLGKTTRFYRGIRSSGGWIWTDPNFGNDLTNAPFGLETNKFMAKVVKDVSDGEIVIIVVDPTIKLLPDPVDKTRPEKTGDGQKWADGVAAKATTGWKDPAPPGRTSVLPGPPKLTSRFSKQTGWHLRVSLGGVETEVPVAQGDKQSDIDARVRKAVTGLRAKYDPAAKGLGPGLRPPPPGGKHDPKAPPPPEWWTPFEVHPSQRSGAGIANAPALPARVEMAAHPEESTPSMVAGSSYEFKMKVQWTDDLHGLASAMNYGYFWEVLAASPEDWKAVAGIPDEDAAAGDPAAGGPAPKQPGKDSAANRKTGSGSKVSRYESATRDTMYTKRDASHDIASTWDDDRVAVGGEAIAGGFKVAKTWVVDVLSGVVKKDDGRSMKLDAPGYYLIRCTAWNTGASAASEFVRAASVDSRPVKVVDANRVAAEGARDQLEKGAGAGAFGQYQQEVATWERRLRGATLLAARRADPAKAVEKLSPDDLAKLARRPATGKEPETAALTDDELQVRAELEVGGLKLTAYVASVKAQLDLLTGDKHSSQVSEWWGNLKTDDTGVRDVALGASFVKERTGERVDLKLMLGQAKDSVEDKPHWVLYDITSPQTRDEYDGIRGEAGPAGHLASIRSTLTAFAGGTPYGRGTFGLAWPSKVGPVSGASLPVLLASEPDKAQRRKSRHQAYVDIATLLIPVAKVAKLRALATLLETLSAVGGGVQAVQALQKRARTGHLYDVGTLLEVVQVVGAVRAGKAAAAGALRSAKVIKEASEVADGISLVAKLDTGVQLMTVTHSVLKCLEEAKAGSPRRQVLQGTYCIAKGIHDGTVTLHAVTEPKYAADEPDSTKAPGKGQLPGKGQAPVHADHEPHGPGIKRTKDGKQQVEVSSGTIEVCPVQRCPHLRQTVGDHIHDPAVADKVLAAEKAARSGHPDQAATDATAALERSNSPQSARVAAAASTEPISKKTQRLLDRIDAATASAQSPIAAELLADLGARVKDRRAKMTADQVEVELLKVPALAEVVAQRRAWEQGGGGGGGGGGKAEALRVLSDLEFGLRSGTLKRGEALAYLDRLRREAGGPATGAPTGSVRDRLSARQPEIAGEFAKADAEFVKDKGEGPPPSARFDAAVAELEKAGMGSAGRAMVEGLFGPRGKPDVVTRGRFKQAIETVDRIVAALKERPDLKEEVGQRHYQASLQKLGEDVAAAYEKGVTLEGRPITNKDAPKLKAAMARMDEALAEQKATTDPVQRLFGLLKLRDEVARASEILRTYDPRFAANQTIGKRRASKQFAGAQELPIKVTASGAVGEPLARNLPGLGLERRILLPREIRLLKTVPPSLASKIAALVMGYERAHLIGPGFGGELAEGLMLAPESVNQGVQNKGVEEFIRTAAARGHDPTVTATATGRRIVVPLENGRTKNIDILTKVDYLITLKDGRTYKVIIEVGAPPGGEVAVHSTIPPEGAGGEILRPPKQEKPE